MISVVGFEKPGGPEVLRVFSVASPRRGPGEVLIRVAYAAVNPSDTASRSGSNWELFKAWGPPYVPGWDVAGTVLEADPDSGFGPGDRVAAVVLPIIGGSGGYSEIIAVDEGAVVRIPDELSTRAASVLPMNGLTALLILDEIDISPGQRIAVSGAAGFLGGLVVRYASLRGAEVVGDAAAHDQEFVLAAGAAHTVPRSARFDEAIHALWQGGADAVVDCAVLGQSALAAVRRGGDLAVVRNPTFDSGTDGRAGVEVHRILVRDTITGCRPRLEYVMDTALHDQTPVRLAADLVAGRAADAHRLLEGGGVRGRITLRF